MTTQPSVVVVDQDVQSRFEIRQLAQAAGFDVAAECGFGIQAITCVQEVQPEVVLIAVRESNERGWQTIRSLLTLFPALSIVAYSPDHHPRVARTAMLAGASDFLPRPFGREDLRSSVGGILQTSENRKLALDPGRGHAHLASTLITVSGAKGGIGKSTVAVNLAAALALRQPERVALIDLDSGFGDVSGMLNVRGRHTLADLAECERPGPAEVRGLLARYEPTSLDVLIAPAALDWRTLQPSDVGDALEKLAGAYDILVVDTSGLLDPIAEVALRISQIVLWVTTTDFASINSSIAALSALQQIGLSRERMRLVVNTAAPDNLVRHGLVQDALGMELFWSLPYDRGMRRATYKGEPVVVSYPQSAVARSFRELAATLMGERRRGSRAPVGRSLRRLQRA